MNKHLLILLVVTSFVSTFSIAAEEPNFVEMSSTVLEDKIRGGLLGQILGNLNGLPHEMKYIHEPGNVENYVPSLPEGARTDDDTDIEWVYIVSMQKRGILKLPPQDIARLWKTHINRSIWCANEYARQLMDIGFEPPLTGTLAFNPWSDFNISGQFLCESFALIAPGMPETASRLALHYTHVGIEGEPAQTTQLFASMIAAAYLTENIDEVIDAGMRAIDPHSAIYPIVVNVRTWHRENPQDWRATRGLIQQKYSRYNGEMRDKNGYELNTASTIGALLYGEGDFVKTLQTAFNFGWDADNNAATSAAVVGVMKGRAWMDQQGWTIVDRYANTTRDQMPQDETITRFGDRLVELAQKAILENGGQRVENGNETFFRIRLQIPAIIAQLQNPEEKRAYWKKTLKPRIFQWIADDHPKARAYAAYAAICLDWAPELKESQPEPWKQAIEALQQYPKLVKVLFESPVPAAEVLRGKAEAAGLKR